MKVGNIQFLSQNDIACCLEFKIVVFKDKVEELLHLIIFAVIKVYSNVVIDNQVGILKDIQWITLTAIYLEG